MHIRNRLVAWHTFILAVLLFVFTFGLYISLSYHLNREVNESLLSWADQKYGTMDKMGHLVGELPGMKGLPKLPESFAVMLDKNGRPTRESSIQSGKVLSRLQSVIRNDLNRKQAVERTVKLEGLPYRLFVFTIRNAADGRAHRLIVGRSLVHVKTTIFGLAIFLSIVWLVAVVICTLVSWFFVSRTLRPVNLMTRTSLQIADSGELGRRIETFGGTDDEFGELSHALNRMLGSLEASNTVQKKFLADASHELRTPLTSVKANLDFLKRVGNLTDLEQIQVLREIVTEVDRMAGLVNELLMLARAEGSSSFPLQPVDLCIIAREAFNGFQYNQNAAERKMRLDIPGPMFVKGDPEKLKQLMIILLDNAIKYTPPGGGVYLTISRRENMAILSITDEGPGIPKTELPLVFDRFYRASNIGTITGSGLGLAIAKSIAVIHNATIELENLVPHGLMVEVKFPEAHPLFERDQLLQEGD